MRNDPRHLWIDIVRIDRYLRERAAFSPLPPALKEMLPFAAPLELRAVETLIQRGWIWVVLDVQGEPHYRLTPSPALDMARPLWGL